MQRLLLDLRDNPGGPLDQAIRVSNRFLPRGDMIVYTRGRVPNSEQDYRATEDGDFATLPVVVLVNRNSASASEIVSGALQDHDRALIVGETTFGKALVQSIYRIQQGAGLALTTARYYTPSGRLIQRPWDGTFDEYLSYSFRDQVPDKPHDAKDLKKTDAGRVRSTAAAASSPTVGSTGRSKASTRRGLPARSTRASCLPPSRSASRRPATRGPAPAARIASSSAPDFVVDDAMVAEFKAFAAGRRREDRRGGVRGRRRRSSRR